MEDPMPSEHDKIDRQKVIASLNTILELELAGVVRYLHYSLMVFGHARIPIIGWMRNQATEGMNHASMAGEHVTALGGHPSLKIGKLAESHKHDIIQILQESLDHERTTLREYYNLLELVVDKSVWGGLRPRADRAGGAAYLRGRENDAQARRTASRRLRSRRETGCTSWRQRRQTGLPQLHAG